MKSLVIALGMVFVGFGSAQAGCTNKPTQQAMNKCAQQVYKKSDSRMNRIYRRAMAAQKSDDRQALRKAQRAWISFRNHACKSYSNLGDGGMIRPLLYSSCLSDLTQQRSKMLQVQTIGYGR